MQVHLALVVLRLVVVPLVVRDDDLAGQRRDRLEVAEHADLDLGPVDELLDEHLLVVLERESRRRPGAPSSSCAFVIPTLEPSRAGLTKQG